MKVTLYMATSIDGFIATDTGDSDWILEPDFDYFDSVCETSDVIIVGNTTYNQFKGDIYPIPSKPNFVISKGTHLNEQYTTFFKSPKEAIKECRDQGYSHIMLVGGGNINGSFLSQGLIDEIIIDIQPTILGTGIKLFEKENKATQLEFITHEKLGQGLNILKYTVKK